MRESHLLQHIYAHTQHLTGPITIPPGDDMGAIQFGNTQLLVTVDQLADGVHFRLQSATLEQIAHKAIVRNLSDVAAMAALPVAAVASAALPRDFGAERAEQLIDHLRACAARYDCPIIGGDISIWNQSLILSVTVFAQPGGVEPVLRSGARLSDHIYVTGVLGGAWIESGGGAHLTAEPRLALARTLATNPAMQLHSMIDLSDGLASDLNRICVASKVAAQIEAAAIPCRPGVDVSRALNDGEDYELCFTASGNVPQEIDGIVITRIGSVSGSSGGEFGVTMKQPDGRPVVVQPTGWDHGSEQ